MGGGKWLLRGDIPCLISFNRKVLEARFFVKELDGFLFFCSTS